MTEGKKHDQGKPRAGLMAKDFSRALVEVAKVTTFGCEKYIPSSWIYVDDAAERYDDALHRHLLADATEHVDSESGLLHKAHTAWNALAVLELALREDEDRAEFERLHRIMQTNHHHTPTSGDNVSAGNTEGRG